MKSKRQTTTPWTTQRRPRSDKKTDIKREAIIETAARLFWDKGYEGASLNEIADALNITKPTLYYYVESKADLLNLCRERAGTELVRGDFEANRDLNQTGRQRLEIFIRYYARAITSLYGRAMLACLNSTEARKDIAGLRHGHRGVTAQMCRFIEGGIADGSLHKCDANLAAFAILGSLNWLPFWYHEDGKASLDHIVTQFIDVYCNGLATPLTPARPTAKAKLIAKKNGRQRR